jgi:hypothetical protein
LDKRDPYAGEGDDVIEISSLNAEPVIYISSQEIECIENIPYKMVALRACEPQTSVIGSPVIGITADASCEGSAG